jgi:hypothetical protein
MFVSNGTARPKLNSAAASDSRARCAPAHALLGGTIALFAVAFLVPAWPWLSGLVTIPWDAKSQFLPPFQFLVRSLATGQCPFWTPNVFAGWPLISDPQSLIFSPLHFLLAYFDPAPSFRAVDGLTFAYLLVGGAGIVLYWIVAGTPLALSSPRPPSPLAGGQFPIAAHRRELLRRGDTNKVIARRLGMREGANERSTRLTASSPKRLPSSMSRAP